MRTCVTLGPMSLLLEAVPFITIFLLISYPRALKKLLVTPFGPQKSSTGIN